MNIIHLTYDSTNYYLMQMSTGWIMVDTGWAGTLSKLLHLLKQKDIPTAAIYYLIITHFHPDHAGLVEDLKDHGAKLLLHEHQLPALAKLTQYFKPQHGFRPIQGQNDIVVSSEESRALLLKAGVKGGLVPTPGHSDDSISLVIDDCCAFTGDLQHPTAVSEEKRSIVEVSWQTLRQYGVQRIYPGHGFPFSWQ
jgi:glyoxylase-like metal-dependent hydrolase (beta-lactamase superfamily II)